MANSKLTIAVAGVVVAVAVAAGAYILVPGASPPDASAKPGTVAQGAGGATGDVARAKALLTQGEQAANTRRDAQARDAYERALAIYRSAGDLAGQGQTQLAMATLARGSGQGDAARELYARARDAFQKSGDALGEAKVWLATGELEGTRYGGTEAALAAYQRAAAMFEALGQWSLSGRALVGVGESEMGLGHGLAGDRAVARARAIFDFTHDREGTNAATRAAQDLAAKVNEYGQARQKLSNDLNYIDQGGSRLLEAQAHLALGRLEVSAGRPSQARRSLEMARTIFAEMRLPNGEMDALAALGDLDRRLGRAEPARESLTAAIAAYRQALVRESIEARQFEEKAEVPLAERAVIAVATRAQIEPDGEARPHLDEARALLPAGQNARADGAMLVAQGTLDAKAGRADAAFAAFAQAVKGCIAAHLDLCAGQALVAQAGAEAGRNNTAVARDLYRGAVDVFIAAHDRIGEAEARDGWARALAADSATRVEANIQYRMAARIFTDLEVPARASAAVSAADALN